MSRVVGTYNKLLEDIMLTNKYEDDAHLLYSLYEKDKELFACMFNKTLESIEKSHACIKETCPYIIFSIEIPSSIFKPIMKAVYRTYKQSHNK